MGYRYTYEVRHEGLGKHRILSGADPTLVHAKAAALWDEWQYKYQQLVARQNEKQKTKDDLEANLREAEERSTDAQDAIEEIKTLLLSALKSEAAVDWDGLRKRPESFSKPKPTDPVYLPFPTEPQSTDLHFQPRLTILDKLFNSRRQKKTQVAEEMFQKEHAFWENSIEKVRKENEGRYAKQVSEVEQWNRDAQAFTEQCEMENKKLEEQKAAYESLQQDGVEHYCRIVLSHSKYPDSFPQDFDLEYNPTTRILIVDYSLPAPEALPRLKEVRFVKGKGDFVETFLTEKEIASIYDEAIYQVCLRTIHELFDADVVKALDAITFNGFVRSIDKATGKNVNGCILSVQAKKDEFGQIDLENVDPKACFRALKGVGSSKLHSLTPIAPVQKISREDKRFISSHSVADQLDDRFNLAAMDWEEFEHLIRQIFEDEFKTAGGEVKVTQASRDGGVDAIAFDPDPIRGGKIVIQANAIPIR